MCEWCTKAKASSAYTNFLKSMFNDDEERIETTKVLASKLQTITPQLYTSMQYPAQLLYPMFDARAAYSVPHNYYQNLLLDGERTGVTFAHGSMRSVFFVKQRLVIFSKNVKHMEGKEFFSGFLLLHLDPKEYSYELKDEELSIKCDITKPLKNLLTGKVEKKKIFFNFVHKAITNRIVSKDQIMSSSHLRSIYSKYGGLKGRMASIDIEGYAITVAHFAPHPYMLQTYKDFGFSEHRKMQEHVLDYFRAHLSG